MRAVLRRRIETQGYIIPDDDVLVKTDHWLRLVPFFTTLITVFSVLLLSPGVLIAVAVVTAAGVVLPHHPLDWAYNTSIRKLEHSPLLPPTPGPRRIAYGIWTMLLGLTSYSLLQGDLYVGMALGWSVAALMGWLAAQQQCLVSEAIRFLRTGRLMRRD